MFKFFTIFYLYELAEAFALKYFRDLYFKYDN